MVQYIKRAELAKMLDCHPRTIYDLTKAGKIPFIKIGSDLRYDPQEVINVLKANSCASLPRS